MMVTNYDAFHIALDTGVFEMMYKATAVVNICAGTAAQESRLCSTAADASGSLPRRAGAGNCFQDELNRMETKHVLILGKN